MKIFLSVFLVFFTSITYAAVPADTPDTSFRLGTFEADGMTPLFPGWKEPALILV